jgi:hypothetical protein
MSAALLFDTVPAAMLRHRLALGLAWTDAISGNGATGTLSTILERIGAFPLQQAFDRHRGDRFALHYAARVRQRIDKAVAGGIDTDVQLHVHAPARSGRMDFDPLQDARTYVPRRLQLALAMAAGEPALTPANIRAPWLWPGATYPFPATATLVRGSVRRGADLATAAPVRWARVFATTPAAETDFALATLAGCAHGDERGEFVLALGANAVSGAALVNPVNVRLWAFAAPPGAVDPADSFLGLPLEHAGAAQDGAVLRGTAVPPAYTEQQSATLALRLGETHGQPATTFLFGP